MGKAKANEDPQDLAEHFRALARKYLGGPLRAEESIDEERIRQAERRLCLTLPESLRAYYLVAGNSKELNLGYNRLYNPKHLVIDGEYLMFMDENQCVVSWGVRVEDFGKKPDPIVWQRNNTEPPEFYSEKKSFSRFMKSLFGFYRSMSGGKFLTTECED